MLRQGTRAAIENPELFTMTLNRLRVATLLAGMLVIAGVSSKDVDAQGPGWMPPNADMFEKDGKIVGTFPHGIQMETTRGAKWVIQVLPQQSQVKITGTADPAFLHPGLHIKFSGDIDDKGVLQSELKELEIFSPAGKNNIGIFPTGSDEKSKPVPRPGAGSYDIRGRVLVYRDGEIVIVAGKKLTGKVAAEAEIAVNVQDLSFAQPEDELTVKGWTTRSMGPNYQKKLPGTAVGREIEIKLSKRLVAAPTKARQRGGKVAKGKQPQNDPVNADDPFGLDDLGKKEGKKTDKENPGDN
jgi:hypothetical protein